MSQFTTSATSAMSSPREPTSVDTSTGTTDARNRPSEDSGSRCVRRECSAVLRMFSVLSRCVRYAAVRGRWQKMIVGGGCSISSSSCAAFFLEPFLAFVGLPFCARLLGSAGVRRRGIVDSGGWQSRWKRYTSRTCEGTTI